MIGEARRSPLIANVALLVAFVAIAVASVFTVLIPALSDAGEDQETAPVEAEAE